MNKFAEAVAKQHEAMKRALHLANRNRELEKELRDIDHMALAVEADANCYARTNAEKVSKYVSNVKRLLGCTLTHFRLQDKIQDALMQIQSLETEVNQLRREKQEILSDWEGTTVEKKHLQALLETALEEKRLMSDRINQFTIIGKIKTYFLFAKMLNKPICCNLTDSHICQSQVKIIQYETIHRNVYPYSFHINLYVFTVF